MGAPRRQGRLRVWPRRWQTGLRRISTTRMLGHTLPRHLILGVWRREVRYTAKEQRRQTCWRLNNECLVKWPQALTRGTRVLRTMQSLSLALVLRMRWMRGYSNRPLTLFLKLGHRLRGRRFRPQQHCRLGLVTLILRGRQPIRLRQVRGTTSIS